MSMRPVYGREKDIEMMSNPENWPRWPRLPIKRSDPTGNHQVEIGVMLALEGHLTMVFKTNMFAKIDHATTDKYVYSDYEAIADDGWVVD